MKDLLSEYTLKQFQMRFYNDLLKKYPLASAEKSTIVIRHYKYEISVSVKEIFEEYLTCHNYDLIYDILCQNLDLAINQYKFKADLDKIYPMIKPVDFGAEENLPFIKDNFFLNLCIFYAQDMNETFRFLFKDDIKDETVLRKRSCENLDKYPNPLEKLDKNMEIYTCKHITDVSSSYLLSEKFQEDILKKVGKRYLLAIPSETCILVAKDYPGYTDILETLVKIDQGPHKISEHIYRYANGKYSYANAESIFRVIK